MNKLICIVGMCGSGKSEVSDFFVKKGFLYLRFGQITLDEVKRRGLEPKEENEKPIREEFRRIHGPGAFATLNIPKFDELLKDGNVVGDGLYSWEEYKILKEKYGDNLIIVACYASPETRYKRLDNRVSRYGADPLMKYRSFSPAEAKSRDYSEIENIAKAGPIAMADFTVVNESTIDELNNNLEIIYSKIGGK